MLSQSVEGMRRVQFGFKGTGWRRSSRGVEPVIGEGDDCKGALARHFAQATKETSKRLSFRKSGQGRSKSDPV